MKAGAKRKFGFGFFLAHEVPLKFLILGYCGALVWRGQLRAFVLLAKRQYHGLKRTFRSFQAR